MSDQNKTGAEDLVDSLTRAVDTAIDSGRMDRVVQSPMAQKVALRLQERDDSPHGRLKMMVENARAELTRIDDEREKLEALREVQLADAREKHAAINQAGVESIAHHEREITRLREEIERDHQVHGLRIIDINAAVDKQVDSLDQMEQLHRNVVETAAKNVTPRKGKKPKDGENIPF